MKYYVTAAIPYVNAKPHIGHALEFLQTDAIARYQKLLGNDVFMLTGGDENALKNVQAAEKAGVDVQEFVDTNSLAFEELAQSLDINFDMFQKASDRAKHYPASQKLWELCNKNGDIYQKEYKGLYCVGCEAFYEKEELDAQGECFEHPGKKLDEVTEKNYFFKLSKYQEKLIDLLENDTIKIVPETRKNEVLSFVKSGLHDISISRSNERARNWGIPVPGDDTQRIYVWYDALNVYQSGIGFGWDEKQYDKWWPADLHVIGKGIIRFHAVYWPAFLLSAGLKLPKEIFVHGYITVEGQKMSKTIGNVIDPIELIEEFGVDPIRYYFLREVPPYGDGDFSKSRFKQVYNADLANGLGNLVSRVAKLAERIGLEVSDSESDLFKDNTFKEYSEALSVYKFNEAALYINKRISDADQYIEQHRPWELEGEKLKNVLEDLVREIRAIAMLLSPIIPSTADKILKQYSGKITSTKPLFPRLQ